LLRRWSRASGVARAAGIHASQLFRWRQELCLLAPSAASAWGIVDQSLTPRGLANALAQAMKHLEFDGLHVSQSVPHRAGTLREAATQVTAGK
jgi:hypothetical protein